MDDFLTDEQMDQLLAGNKPTSNIAQDFISDRDMEVISLQQLPSIQDQKPQPNNFAFDTSYNPTYQGYQEPAISKAIAGTLASATGAAQGATFNFLDEITAGVKTPFDYIGNRIAGEDKGIGQVYRENLDQTRQGLNELQEEFPIVSTGSEIAGSFVNPLAKVAPVTKAKGLVPVLTNASKVAGVAAADSAVDALGRSEGSAAQNISDALQGAKTGAIFGGGLHLAGKGARKIGEVASNQPNLITNSIVGIKEKHIKKSILKHVGGLKKDGMSRVEEAKNNLLKNKNIKLSNDPMENRNTLESFLEDYKDTKLKTYKKLSAVKADVRFNKTLDYIENQLPVDEQKYAKDELQRIKKELYLKLNKGNRFDKKRLKNINLTGDVQFLEKERINQSRFGKPSLGQTGTDEIKSNLRKWIAVDLDDSITSAIDNFKSKPELQSEYNSFLNSRKTASDAMILKEVLEEAAVDEKTTLLGKAKKLIRTSGGYGTLIGALTGLTGGGLPALMIGAGLGYTLESNPSKRLAASGLGALGNTLTDKNLHKALEAANVPLARALSQKAIQSSDEETTISPLKLSPQQYNKVSLEELPENQYTYNNNNAEKDSLQQENVLSFIQQQDPLIQSIIEVESNNNPRAQSKVGARGLMQIMPFWDKELNIKNAFDPVENVTAGKEILNREIQRFGDIYLAIAAYNAGSPAVTKAIQQAGSKNIVDILPYLPPETQNYIRKVEQSYLSRQNG